MPFQTLNIRSAEHIADPATGQHVYHVHDPHALVQAAGYLKHIHGCNGGEHIFFRGESKLYGTLSPTLYRGISSSAAQSRRTNLLKSAIDSARKTNGIFANLDKSAYEPLLQHYGLKTSWLDVVDNIWVALWFSCHRAYAVGPVNEYLHFEQRTEAKDPGGFAYVLLVSADARPVKRSPPGVVIGNDTELIDLRVAAPSIFLRPHAQHGLLMRMRGESRGMRPMDYSPQIRGVIRINLADALGWLGHGKMLGIHGLFPPPYYDQGYDILLRSGISGSREIGSIHHIGS
nr:FRG domain-containing protein [Achromobacter xylosoxidans]